LHGNLLPGRPIWLFYIGKRTVLSVEIESCETLILFVSESVFLDTKLFCLGFIDPRVVLSPLENGKLLILATQHAIPLFFVAVSWWLHENSGTTRH
jgi:hypothetical protein